jgi:hypothetical protein
MRQFEHCRKLECFCEVAYFIRIVNSQLLNSFNNNGKSYDNNKNRVYVIMLLSFQLLYFPVLF